MRIEKLKIVNINSLKGSWEIDFSDAAYDVGIFSITGPTGAGKSTILDALCLSLFGRTPRLGQITKSTNEAMNRESGFCQAECTFVVPSGRYRASWSQNRARGKIDGNLQDAQHLLWKEMPGGEYDCLEGKTRLAQKLIQEVLGLDFEQFTRSVLLAQGNFANLLRSEESVKSQILEDITGTGIYSEIGKKVFERTKTERLLCEEVERKMAESPALNPQEQQALQEQLERSFRKEEKLQTEENDLRTLLTWRQDLDKLLKDQATNQANTAKLEGERAEIMLLGTQIDDCERAVSIEVSHQLLADAQKHYKSVLQSKQEQTRLQAQLVEENLEKEAAVKRARDNATDATEASHALRNITKDVRALDTQINAVAPQVADIRKQLRVLSEATGNTEKSLKKARAALSDKKGLKQDLKAWYETHPDIGLLSGKKDALQLLQDNFEKRWAEQEKIRNRTLPLCQKQIREKQSEVDRTKKHQERLADRQNTDSGKKTALEDAARALFRDYDALLAETERLNQAEHTVQEQKSASQKLDEIQNKVSESEKSLLRSQEAQSASTKERLAIENQLKDENDRIASLREIEKLQKYEADRARLKAGEPCPLCGAIEHPLCDEVLPSMKALTQQIEEAETRIQDLGRKEKVLQRDLSRQEAEIESLRKELENQLAEHKRAQEALERCIPADLDITDTKAVHAYIDLESDVITSRRGEFNQKTVSYRELQKKIADLDEALETRAQEVRSAEDRYQKEDEALRELVRTESQWHERLRELGEENAVIQSRIVERYGTLLSEPHKTDLRAGFSYLLKACEVLSEKEDLQSALDRDIPLLEERVTSLVEQAEKAAIETQNWEQKRQDAESELNKLQDARKNLFGNQNPDEEERKAQDALDQATKALDSARKQQDIVSKNLASVRGQLNRLETQESESAQQVQDHSMAWAAALTQKGFATEVDWQQALSHRGKIAGWRLERETFQKKEHSLLQEKAALEKKIAEANAVKKTDLSRTDLNRLLEEALTARAENLKELGQLKERKEQDDSAQKALGTLRTKLEKQRNVYADWDRLNEMIGSADGKKYRGIVQRITFKVLLQYANRALQVLNPRYELTAEDNTGLEILVRDLDLGGEVRPSTNLSGGETFLVSLALALGLSQMASRKVQISSLFLDEGFGTLDEKSLEDALNALSVMNRNGNLIGVISHVGKIHDRIPVGVKITPDGGGASTLEGNGVRRLKS